MFGFNNESKRKRFDLFNIWSNDVKDLGLIANSKEWHLELPNKTFNEKVTIIGVNSWGQSLQLNIVWRPLASNKSAIKVNFVYSDGKGNSYYMDEQGLMPFDETKCEYKAPGIALQILNPFRRLRIKLRGCLKKKGSNDLVFVKIKLLWLSVSNVFDMKCDHKKSFIEKETKNKSFNEIDFENRFEQLGQMKGTLQVENQKEEKLFLWGNKSKKIEEKDNKREIYRLFGYSKKGLAFHIGLVVDEFNEIRYRYGFAFWGQNLIHPINSLSDIDFMTQSMSQSFSFDIKCLDKTFIVLVNKGLINENILDIEINGVESKAVFSVENEENLFDIKINFENQLYFPVMNETLDLVLPLNDRKAENVLISGGKGSSLASLNYLKETLKYQCNFEVPKGVVVTTNSYEILLKQNKPIVDSIKRLKTVLKESDLLKTECNVVSNIIKSSYLPQEVKEEIRSQLEVVFGKTLLKNKSFAVRSSASGEDSEEMSAAGQMTTYLGVRGFDSIYNSVLKCWSSQFSFVAVEYKRGYGQDINSPMAVVIQEMVDCHSAGVLFTCDPLSGDERQILITGNYGIGESVVSGMAEPDTIRVGIKLRDNSYNNRTVKEIKSIEIGKKAMKMVGTDSGGTVLVKTTDSDKCCLSNKMAISLANSALEIQKFFGSVRDIEWGVRDGQIYILQCRPVTHLDSGFTEFEIIHELDSGLPSEMEFITKANTGEVIRGSSSALNLSLIFKSWAPTTMKITFKAEGRPNTDYCPYSGGPTVHLYNHTFLKLNNAEFFKFTEESDLSKAMVLAIIGHEIDPDIMNQCKSISPPDSAWVKFKTFWHLLPFLLFSQYCTKKYAKEIRKYRYVLDEEFDSSLDMFEAIVSNMGSINKDQLIHLRILQVSSIYNMILLKILLKDTKNPNVYSDFALLMSSCGQMVSSDVPLALRQLAESIENPELFKQLSDENAFQYLMNGNNKSNELFKQFLQTHGHRGLNEIEPLVKVWRQNPIPLLQSIKTLLLIDFSIHKTNDKICDQNILDSLKTPLSFWQKFMIKHIVLPLARRTVPLRESTKSSFIYGIDLIRQSLWALADRMHSEGLIPESDLLFHMTGDEIGVYLKTRNPILISKAKLRKKFQKQMNEWIFDEFIGGYDFKPKHLMSNTKPIVNSGQVVKGVPVSVGRIRARVCVAIDLKDAISIQPGDILITYSTDIGWSPYFTIIGGIVTEIGGLISHGAVIAREYGLPCLIGATDASSLFKTGDIALLDCEEGIIVKLDEIN